MTSTKLKIARRRMLREHAERLRQLDIAIAEAGRRERYEIPEPEKVRPLIAKLRKSRPGASWGEVATELNRRGYKAPKGKRWSGVAVERWFNQGLCGR